MIKHITTDDVRRMADAEGLILQGCGGNPQEWMDGINEMLAEAGILQNGGKFTEVNVFEHEGLTNILFPLDGMDPGTLHMGKLAMWRLQSHSTFGGTWLSDYLPNTLGVEANVSDEKESVIKKIREIKAAAKTAPVQQAQEKSCRGKKNPYDREV